MSERGQEHRIEAYVLDFDGDLYGQRLDIEFLKRLRGEKSFPTIDELIAQMAQDVDEARATVHGRS